jgi:NADH-quinone oxidoreductase subunit A
MEWMAVAIYTGVCAGLAAVIIIVSAIFGPKRYKEEKFGPYECGVDPIGSARERFSVHFYLVAILFILFDIEMVFLIPWAVLYRKLGIFGLVEAGIFLAVLGFGLAYVWRKKALKWD